MNVDNNKNNNSGINPSMPELAYAGQTSADTSVSAPSNCRDIVLKGDLAEYFSMMKTNCRYWVVQNFDIDNHAEPKGSVNAIPSTITKYFKENGKTQFVNVLKGILKKFRTVISQELKNYPELPIPTQKGLEAIASHYSKKYGVLIFYVHIDQVKEFLEAKRKEYSKIKTPSYIGLIIHEDNEQTKVGHTIPMLTCCVPGKEQRFECFIMDVRGISEPVGPDANCLDNRLRKCLADCHVEDVFSCDGFRQADEFSCRTGSLILLRNALLFYKKEWE